MFGLRRLRSQAEKEAYERGRMQREREEEESRVARAFERGSSKTDYGKVARRYGKFGAKYGPKVAKKILKFGESSARVVMTPERGMSKKRKGKSFSEPPFDPVGGRDEIISVHERRMLKRVRR